MAELVQFVQSDLGFTIGVGVLFVVWTIALPTLIAGPVVKNWDAMPPWASMLFNVARVLLPTLPFIIWIVWGATYGALRNRALTTPSKSDDMWIDEVNQHVNSRIEAFETRWATAQDQKAQVMLAGDE